jgi:hypothetical protein
MSEEGLEEAAEKEDEYSRERHLDTTLTSDHLRLKYIQEGRFGNQSPKRGLTLLEDGDADTNGNSHPSRTPTQPTLFFLDVGAGESVHSMEEAMTAGKILSTTSDGKQANPFIIEQSCPDGIDINLHTSRIFWTNMGVTGVKDGSVMSPNLDSMDIRLIPPKDSIHTPKQLAVGSSDQEFYWTQKSPSKAGKGRIFRAGTTMLEYETPGTRTDIELLFSDLAECVDLEYQPMSQSLCWTDHGEHPGGNTLNVSYVGRDSKPANSALAIMPHRNVLNRHLHETIAIRLDARNRCVIFVIWGGRFITSGGWEEEEGGVE